MEAKNKSKKKCKQKQPAKFFLKFFFVLFSFCISKSVLFFLSKNVNFSYLMTMTKT